MDGVFIVTGGSRGIGAAIAESAARAGYTVLLTYASDAASAEAVVGRIRATGGTAEAVRADTSVAAEVSALFEAADRLGPLRVMVYNAGITGRSSPLVEADPADVANVVAVNLTGAIYCAREAIARLSTARGGTGGAIVLVSSRATSYGSPGEHVWYAASKGGIDSLAIGLSREVGPEGIRVNVVSPGPVATDMLSEEKRARATGMSPLGRIGEPQEVADAVMFLVSAQATFVTGANLAVSGGR